MNLDFSKERLLVLYKETYQKDYNPNSQKKLIGNIKLEHQNMMYMMYLIQALIKYMDVYGFVWDFNGPYSRPLQAELQEIDKNVIQVKNFYDTYAEEYDYKQFLKYMDSNQISESIQYLSKSEIQRLKLLKYFYQSDIKTLENFFYLIVPFSQKYENGMQVIASIHFLASITYPASDYKYIFNKYNELTQKENDRSLLLKAWDCLDNLNLLYETQSRKLKRK